MRLYSWNVNGIRAVLRKNSLLPFIEEHQPDILCLQEIKARPEQIELELPGYQLFWNPAKRAGYSGTAIFSKQKPLSVRYGLPDDLNQKYQLTGDGYGDPSSEGRVLSIELDDYWLVTVYTPNAKDDLTRLALREKHWDPAFLDYLNKLRASKPVVFCGDLNVAHTEDDLANPKANKGKKGFTLEERRGFDNFLQANFSDSFRLFHSGNGYYTWWSHFANARARNVGWRIDYFMVDNSLKDRVVSAEIHPNILGSDHCPVSLNLS